MANRPISNAFRPATYLKGLKSSIFMQGNLEGFNHLG
jgi:hypothetical protein